MPTGFLFSSMDFCLAKLSPYLTSIHYSAFSCHSSPRRGLRLPPPTLEQTEIPTQLKLYSGISCGLFLTTFRDFCSLPLILLRVSPRTHLPSLGNLMFCHPPLLAFLLPFWWWLCVCVSLSCMFPRASEVEELSKTGTLCVPFYPISPFP